MAPQKNGWDAMALSSPPRRLKRACSAGAPCDAAPCRAVADKRQRCDAAACAQGSTGSASTATAARCALGEATSPFTGAAGPHLLPLVLSMLAALSPAHAMALLLHPTALAHVSEGLVPPTPSLPTCGAW